MVHQSAAIAHVEIETLSVIRMGAEDVALPDAYVGRRGRDGGGCKSQGCNDRLHVSSRRPCFPRLSAKSPVSTMQFPCAATSGTNTCKDLDSASIRLCKEEHGQRASGTCGRDLVPRIGGQEDRP